MAKTRKEPGYLKLHQGGILLQRAEAARGLLTDCRLCPHGCGVCRLHGKLGLCRTGARARVASYGPHFGEEAPLVGTHGSGAIFFEGCTLLCVFCQNHDISHIDKRGDDSPRAVTDRELAEIMLKLQEQGCHNINFVTPTHVVPQILAALPRAVERGLRVPLVYNSGGYDSRETLKLLDGIIDIYMPDCKFMTPETAGRYTRAPDYPEIMQRAVREMHRQTGDLVLDDTGLAVRGLLARHLVMPGHLDETDRILAFLAGLSKESYVNIMEQYRPCHRATGYPPINRPVSREEYSGALDLAARHRLRRLELRDWRQLLNRLFSRSEC